MCRYGYAALWLRVRLDWLRRSLREAVDDEGYEPDIRSKPDTIYKRPGYTSV
jgi:hypothetical protein